MPRVQSTAVAPVSPEVAFDVSQSHGAARRRWDPFIHRQRFLDGATDPDVGVRTETISRHRLRMVSTYTTFNRPTNVGMKMVVGPPFFDRFAGGWRFGARDDGHTDVTWSYHFAVRPSWLARVADPIGVWLLGGDVDRRLAAFVAACSDAVVLAAVGHDP